MSLYFTEDQFDKNFLQIQIEYQKSFNLVTNFIKIGSPKPRYIRKCEKHQNCHWNSECRMTLKTIDRWNTLKSTQKVIETCGLHHKLALELLFYNLMDFGSNFNSEVTQNWAQSDQISTFSQQPPCSVDK